MPKATVVAKIFIINSDGLILALRRSKTDPSRPLTWDLPGGEVENLEDPNEAVIRETFEEAGLKIESPIIFYTTATNIREYVVRLLFYAYSDGMTIKLSFEHDQYKWVTKAEFKNLDIPEHYKFALDQLPN